MRIAATIINLMLKGDIMTRTLIRYHSCILLLYFILLHFILFYYILEAIGCMGVYFLVEDVRLFTAMIRQAYSIHYFMCCINKSEFLRPYYYFYLRTPTF